MEEKIAQLDHSQRELVQDRIRGAVFGLCCGNSLGGSVLGLNYRQIAIKTGISGLRDFGPGVSGSTLPTHQPGNLLSDALLNIALAESLIATKGRFQAADYQSRIARLLEDEAFLNTEPGVVVLKALRAIADGSAGPDSQGEHVNAACRALLAGCLPGNNVTDSPVEIAVKQSTLGGGDSRAAAAAAVLADSVRYLVAGGNLKEFNDAKSYVLHEYEIAGKLDERFSEAWDDVAPDLDYSSQAEELPYSLINVESKATELVPTAVGIFLIFRQHPEEAITAAARAGGDTDTVAAVVGALAGAYHGASSLPERWVSKIAHKEKLDSIAKQLFELWA